MSTIPPPPTALELQLVGNTFNTSYYTHDDDILVICPTPGFRDNEESAQINIDYQNEFARELGRPCGLVVVLERLLGMDAGARRVYSKKLDPSLFFAAALVVPSPLSRAVGSFFIGLTKPIFPTRLVDTVDSGAEWLATQRPGTSS